MAELNNNWFPFLSAEEFEKLQKVFSSFPTDLMPHQIAVQLGIDLSRAFSVIYILSDKNISDTLLLIYHKCDSSKVVDAMPFGTGFPELPWTCPDCDEEVSNYSELNFDIMSNLVIHKAKVIILSIGQEKKW